MEILYQDQDIIVVDKPGGLLSVPGRGHGKQDCVVARVQQLFPEVIKQPAVHRLDMWTSGVMVLAKTSDAHRNLSRQFMRRQIKKLYIALLEGLLKQESGTIELKFRLDIDNRPCQVYDPDRGKLGITSWQKIGEENGCTRVRFIPLTGRTHQLRVHAAHKLGLNCPIVGDALYGSGKYQQRMMLHAFSLTMIHPRSKKKQSFTAKVPF